MLPAAAQPAAANSAELASPLSPPKEPPPKSYNFFVDQGDHLKDLADAREFESASSLYSKYRDEFFYTRQEKYAQVIGGVAIGLDGIYKQVFAHSGNALVQHIGTNESNWPAARDAVDKASQLLEAFTALPIVKDFPTQPPNAAELRRVIEESQAYWRKQAAASFALFDLKRDFFASYPIKLSNPAEVLEEAVPQMIDALRSAGRDSLLIFAKTYKPVLGSSKAHSLLSNLYVEMELQSAGASDRLRFASKALANAREAGLNPTQVPRLRVAFAEATSQTLLKEGQIEFPVSIELNLPFEVKKTSLDEALAADGSQFDYVIVLDVSLARTLQRVQKREEMPSQYLAGVRQQPNPVYEQARMAVYQAQSALNSNQSQYCYGAGCLGKAIAGIALAARLQEQQNFFAATPMMIDHSVYAEYNFSVSDVEARKAVTANYYVIDLASRTYFKSLFDVAEAKTFRVAYRLHDKDKDRASHLRNFNSENDVKKFNDEPSSVKLSDVLDQYLKNPGQVQTLKNPVAMRNELLEDKNKALATYKETSRLQASTTTPNDSRFASVVVVHNPKKNTMGAGFFVESDLVLTNYHVVEGSQFVEMKLFSGLETFGKVVKSDARLDLALVKVQARGVPVTFFDGPIPLGSTVEAVGHPRGLTFSVTRGIVSAIRKRQGLIGVGGKEVTFVQTDTPINPGNSGGPLFLDGKVVGVNDWKLSEKGIEGIGFSIHYTEVMAFLKEGF
jgi:serine protease Do